MEAVIRWVDMNFATQNEQISVSQDWFHLKKNNTVLLCCSCSVLFEDAVNQPQSPHTHTSAT